MGGSLSKIRTVDAAAHPYPRNQDDIRKYMGAPLSHLRFPGLDGYFYPPPEDELSSEFAPPGGLPGSDPELLSRQLLSEPEMDAVVLLPLTRGLLPDVDMASEICAGTNRWLAEEWLSYDPDRFFGSIRINPADPSRAMEEIQRWADHPQMVQVAVPLQAHQPYGQRRFRPIWQCAADHGLPVAVHADSLGGNEFWPTSVGYPLYYVEYASQYSINYIVHLMSLIAEGVLEDVDNLIFVFADGGIDMLFPLIWRIDSDWRPLRSVTPWVKRPPVDYLGDHVRFCSQRFEGPVEPEGFASWLDAVEAARLLMYSSNYPCVSLQSRDAFDASPSETRDRVLGGNALELYPKLASRVARI
jgi:predicted TIM-barrel fold metal-dependent hydrolase